MVAVGLLLNSYLMLGAMRQSVQVQRDWNESVRVIAQWQGPLVLTTEAQLDARATTLGVQEARGPHDVENGVERMRDGLKRLARIGN